MFPTLTADTFGAKYIAQNYGWVFLSYGVGGIVGPIMGGRLGDIDNFPKAFTICGVMCLAARSTGRDDNASTPLQGCGCRRTKDRRRRQGIATSPEFGLNNQCPVAPKRRALLLCAT